MERHESWFDRAKSSLELAKAIVSPFVYYEDLCYQTQQAVEKALKGLLIYFKEEPSFTHNIEILLDELLKYTDVPENVKNATKLTKYAVLTRYPGEYDELTKEDYEESINIATNCLEWVNSKIKEYSPKAPM
jgi:HEPN domain-containing protein